VLLGHRRECGVEFGGTSGLQELKLHSQPSGGHLQVSYRQRVGRIGRVRQDRDAADLGDGLLEQLQPFAESFHADAVRQPVTFPPGRARLAMSPSPSGSPTTAMAMGIVAVAFFAAAAAGVGPATMMSTLSRTNSAASSGRRSNRPSANR